MMVVYTVSHSESSRVGYWSTAVEMLATTSKLWTFMYGKVYKKGFQMVIMNPFNFNKKWLYNRPNWS